MYRYSPGFAAQVVRVHDKEGAPLWCMVYAAPLWDRGKSGATPRPSGNGGDSESDEKDSNTAAGGHGDADIRGHGDAADGDGDNKIGEDESGDGGDGIGGRDGGLKGAESRGGSSERRKQQQQRPQSTGTGGGGGGGKVGGVSSAAALSAAGPAYVYIFIDVTLRRPWRVGRYQLGEVLGKGSFGEVRVARDREARGAKEGGPGFGTGWGLYKSNPVSTRATPVSTRRTQCLRVRPP